MPSIGSLNAILTLNSKRFEKGMDRSRKKLKGYNKRVQKSSVLTRAFSGALTQLGTALAGVAGVAGISRMFRSVESFNQEMRSSQAIMGELTQNQMKRMERSAIRVAKETRTSSSEAARSFFFLASAGLDAEQSIAALPQVAQFAQAGMFSMATATDLATDAQSALGLTVADAQQNLQNLKRTTDVLVKANTLANASVEQFSSALTRKAGAALKNLNKDIEEGVAVLAAFADQGVKSERAGTALDIVLRRLAIGARENAGAWERLGVQVFDQEGNFRNTGKIIEELTSALDGMSDITKDATLAQLGFTARNLAFTKTLLGTGEAIQEYERQLRKAAGTTREVANKQLTPFAKGWNQLSGAIVDVGRSMSGMIDAFGKLFGFIGRNLKTILQLTASFVAFVATGPAVVGMLNLVIGALKSTSIVMALVQTLLAGPRGLINLMLGLTAATVVWQTLDHAIEDSSESMAKAEEAAADAKKAMDDATDGAGAFGAEIDKANQKMEELADTVRDHPLERFASKLKRQVLTPLEELRLQVAQVWMAFQEGLINVEVFRRALRDAGQEFKDATRNQQPQRFDAFERGSRRAIEAILRFQTQDRGMGVEQAQLKESKQQTKELRGIRRGLSGGGDGGGREMVVNF